jgi:hypothetical protein
VGRRSAGPAIDDITQPSDCGQRMTSRFARARRNAIFEFHSILDVSALARGFAVRWSRDEEVTLYESEDI